MNAITPSYSYSKIELSNSNYCKTELLSLPFKAKHNESNAY